jgi:hypothetical protein
MKRLPKANVMLQFILIASSVLMNTDDYLSSTTCAARRIKTITRGVYVQC